MDCQGMLAIYANVAGITEQMLAAARCGDWEHVTTLETSCASQIAILKTEEASAAAAWTGEAIQDKARLIQQILSDYSEIRQLTEPQVAQLLELIDNRHTAERKLVQAYGSDPDF